jgi:hypothetical protein
LRILFYSGGVTGSGHIVLGLSVAAALKRAGAIADFAILSVETPFSDLARRLGISVATIPFEDEVALGPNGWRDSRLFAAIAAYAPDIIIVDQFWFTLEAFIREIPCRKVLLLRQVDPRFFRFVVATDERCFRPIDYALVIKTEPGFELPFEAHAIEPIIIRNRDEILSREAALGDLKLASDARPCLFAFNGNDGEGAQAWKTFSYLEKEGWTIVRSDNRRGGLFPVVEWFEAFDLLICGAGYSAFWEARYFQKEAFFVPFPRHFENQERRIALCSDYNFDTNGADELVKLFQYL